MNKVSVEDIRQLREETGLSVIECKKALQEAAGDMAKAKDFLRAWGKKVVEKKHGREAQEGLIEGYIHSTGKVGVLVEMRCETDFVARSQDFKNLSHEFALQIASMDPQDVDALMEQQYIKDPSKTMKDVLGEAIAKLGENIFVERFSRLAL